MKDFKFIIGVILLVSSSLLIASPARTLSDSVGLEKKEDQWYILHEVEKGESMYRISQRYHVDVDRIEKGNNGTSALSSGQMVRIPYSSGPYIVHKVSAGETMYAISKRYNISVDDIKKWNQLTGTDLSREQKLKIYECNPFVSFENSLELSNEEHFKRHQVQAGESIYGISRMYGVEVDNIKSWNSLDTNDISPGQILIIKEIPVVDKTPNEFNGDNHFEKDSLPDSSNVLIPYPIIYIPFYEERGIAELIDGPQDTSKFLALHRTAKPGSVLLIRNELNNQMVFVRVIGKLPDTGANNKLVVKISRAAWENINAVNRKLRVKVSYFR